MVSSRRRKTKCDGSRPCCRNCSRLQDNCGWPTPPVGLVADQPSRTLPVVSVDGFPKHTKVQRLLELFYRLHLDVEFCSFLHRHSFDLRRPQSPFLIASIIALSALYIPDLEAQEDFGFVSAAALSNHYLLMARDFSRNLSQAYVFSVHRFSISRYRSLLPVPKDITTQVISSLPRNLPD